ncbi:ligand-gated channel protein [Alcaligenes pakistanensis]|uniref:Ligand-gated channel protein n=1 Tax=Alcaligenes pakistanensis TaxID=1482717 RepID=A0A8H9IPV3_9BURK|nr:ligand-gated channel protein [Alcaligenes pakistanensis]GHC50322.1 ligand-gated channel protein [Alcaligenes pakistanensis]
MKSLFTVKRLPLVLAGVFAASGAVAQQSTPVQLSPVVVTASGFEQDIKEAPASITVITREELENKFYRDAYDALQDVPGVIVTGGGDRRDITIRGMSSKYTLILIDGKRQSSAETRTNSDSSGVEGGWTPPLSEIERIEVVRGPMSSLYGSDAMGGVINIITRKVPKEWGGSIRLDSTLQAHSRSGDIFQGNFMLGGPIKEGVLGLQVYGQQTNRKEDDIYDGYRKRESFEVGAKLSLTPTENHSFVLEGSSKRQKYNSTLGKTVEPIAPGVPCDRSGCPDSSETDYRGEKVSLTHSGNWGFATSDTYVQQEDFNNKSRDMRIKNTDARTAWVAPLGDHLLTIGSSYQHQKLNDQTGNQLTTGINRVKRTQWALFLEDEWSLTNSFALTGGVRYDHDENYSKHFSPRVYGVWTANDNWTIKGGVSTGFRAPDLRQTVAGWGQVSRGGNMYGNPDLKPEKSLSQEFGVMYDTLEGFSAGVTLFNNDFKDKITRIACPLSKCTDGPNQFGSNPTTYENVDKAVTRGVETNFSWDLAQDWTVKANYTYTDSKQKSGPNEGQPLNQMPKHMANVSLDWRPTEKISTWARVNFRGKESEPVTSASSSTTKAPSYTFVDLGGTYKLNKNVDLYAGIYNIMDKQIRYEDYSYVEDGRRYWLGVGLRF